MGTLAEWHGGPGPWVMVVPIIWAVVVIGVVTFLRRTAPWRGRGGRWRGMTGGRPAGDSPLSVLGRRFASGEIDEEEYWRRLSVLEEHFGAVRKAGSA
ncbi:SHOCT domain-containing protein [Streptomyces sp. J2-1]|uniref:SHOCT domain-containing protein n=1 Tax=Streptomyces corallincola TaxID=2851888 RepID=UPI001C394782|nr:SHOCT domain-containing protein [Streptomyces corallincola]MBV2352889.1 SHOCT domain-containing protein [Streptomyces corallincola]